MGCLLCQGSASLGSASLGVCFVRGLLHWVWAPLGIRFIGCLLHWEAASLGIRLSGCLLC